MEIVNNLGLDDIPLNPISYNIKLSGLMAVA